MADELIHVYANQLTILARQLNAFVGSLRSQRKNTNKRPNPIRETSVDYTLETSVDTLILFKEDDLEWLQTILKT